MTETLRLRCLRCGDWHEREAGDAHFPELCARCVDFGLCVLSWKGSAAFSRWHARWEKAPANHPTRVALREAWARWEAENDFAASAAMEDP